MKQITRIFVVFLISAAFCTPTLQAQDSTNFAEDPYGTNGGAYNPTFVPAQTTPAPQSGIGSSAFHEEGIASWYGTEFEGQPTASGELFNPAQMTAAHPNLPFGAMLRVTNTQNNRQVIVRVNDRGPFVSTRIIDVSRAAAEVLDMISTGTAPVMVDLAAEGTAVTAPPIPPAAPADSWLLPPPAPSSPAPQWQPSTPVPQPTPQQVYPAQPYPVQPPVLTAPSPAVVKPRIPPVGTNKRYRVQVGAYKVTKNAVEAFDRIKSLGIEPAYERYDDYYRVVIPGIRAEDIQSLAERLGSLGFREVLLREE